MSEKQKQRSEIICFLVKQRRQNCAKEQMISTRCRTCKKMNFRRTTKNRRSSRLSSAASTTRCRIKKEQQELVGKGNKVFEEAMDKVRNAEYRWKKQQKKLEEEQQALDILLEIHARWFRRPSETTESPAKQPWLPRDAAGVVIVHQCFGGPVLHEAFFFFGNRRTTSQRGTRKELAIRTRHAAENSARQPSAASRPEATMCG